MLNFFLGFSVFHNFFFFFLYILVNLHAIQFHENTATRFVTWELMDSQMDDQTDATEIIFPLAQASKN